MMKIIVTGCTGFIGGNLLEYLKDRYCIVGVTRHLGNLKSTEQIRYEESDYSIDSLKNIFKEADAVIHLASQKVGKQEEEGVKAYIESFYILENVITAADMCGIRNVINISSRCVYGNYTETGFSELDATHPINKYGVMKVCGENLSEYYNRTRGMRIKNLRLSQVVGYPMKDKYMFSTFLDKVVKNEPLDILGQGIGKRDYIYIKDVCRAIECAVQKCERFGIYNIGSGVGISNKDIAEKMVEIFESKSKINVIKTSPKDSSKIILNVEKAEKELGFVCQYHMENILFDIKNRKRGD